MTDQVVAHLQAVDTDSTLAQFQQWLRTYLLYAGEAVTPSVQRVDVPATSPATRRPALQQMGWKGERLQVTSHLLQAIPPRLLALLAVRHYVRHQLLRQHLKRSLFQTVLLMVVFGPLVFWLTERLAPEVREWAFSIVVLPLHLVWSWRYRLEEEAERETLHRTREVETLFEALEAVARLDLKVGVPDTSVNTLLARLNRLREEHGYPSIQREHLQPPPPPEEASAAPPPPSAVGKDELLRRHPPDEYRQVDRVGI